MSPSILSQPMIHRYTYAIDKDFVEWEILSENNFLVLELFLFQKKETTKFKEEKCF